MKTTIRPLAESDAYVSVKWRNDPQVFKYTGNTYDHEITLDSELAWIRKVMANQDEYRCAIIADDKYVGNIYLTGIHDGQADYHIFIGDRTSWGKGIAAEASRLILRYGFDVLGLDRVNLNVRPDNIAAVSLYDKLGFRRSHNDVKKGFINMYIEKDA